ncbi:MAG: DUF368 domain-containing protein [Bacteroidia bacterium]
MISINRITLFLKGMAMGAADVVPGVSGGTIAFISGIYEELLNSISNINLDAFKKLFSEGIKAFWKHINGAFLLTLVLGIGTSIALFAKLIKYLLENEAILLWSFFFGLIVASVWLVGKQVKQWNSKNYIGLAFGTAIAYYITLITPTSGSENLLYIFICGIIAITAMILPGISGSFILLLLGAYTTVLGEVSDILSAIKDADLTLFLSSATILFVFALGCITGLISFSKLLSWLFSKAHDLTVAILTGFLIGSLNKVWPWKQATEVYVKHQGEVNEVVVPLVEKNLSPFSYTNVLGEPHQLTFAIILCVVGMLLILVLDKFSPEKK